MTTRTERRRAEKAARKIGGAKITAQPGDAQPQIQLQNPVSHLYASFTIGNALKWEAMAHNELIRVNREAAESLEPYWGLMALIQSNFQDAKAFDDWNKFRRMVDEQCDERFVVKPDSQKGKHLVICGAGPSLVEEAAEWVPQGDQVWGCNSALTWLVGNGYTPTHGFTVDQTEDMLPEWQSAPDVEYLLATTVHPYLADHLVAKERRIRWFHNFVGMQRKPVSWPDDNGVLQEFNYEDWLYWALFPSTLRAGSGLNSVTRAIDVALVMGFDKITVLGADCAMRCDERPPAGLQFNSPEHLKWLKEHTVLHADGGHALASNSTAVTLGAEVDSGTPDDTVRPGHGVWWESKIDLLLSARWLLVMERHWKDRLNIVGNTYVAAIRGKNRAFLERLPAMVDSHGNAIEISFDDKSGEGETVLEGEDADD